MDNIKDLLNARTNRDIKRKVYRALWVRVNFAIVKDNYIRDIGAQAFGIFFVILAYTNKEDIAFPSLKTISYHSGCSVGTVITEINKLINKGWLVKMKRIKLHNGKFANTRYKILQKDLIRGIGQKGFIEKPVSNFDNG